MSRNISQFLVQTQKEHINEVFEVIKGNSFTVSVSLQLSSFPVEVVDFNLGGVSYAPVVDDAGNFRLELSSEVTDSLNGTKQLSITTSSDEFGAKKLFLGKLKFISTENKYSDSQISEVSDIFFQLKISDDFRLSSDISLSVITGKDGPAGPVGPAGADGKDGIDGKDGETGMSSYQEWLSKGNTGSFDEFIDKGFKAEERDASLLLMAEATSEAVLATENANTAAENAAPNGEVAAGDGRAVSGNEVFDEFRLNINGGEKIIFEDISDYEVIPNSLSVSGGVINSSPSWSIVKIPVVNGDELLITISPTNRPSGTRAVGIFQTGDIFRGLLASYNSDNITPDTFEITATYTGYLHVNIYTLDGSPAVLIRKKLSTLHYDKLATENFVLQEIAKGNVEIQNSSYTEYYASIKNRSGVVKNNEIVYLVASFKYGEVKNFRCIVVEDEEGNQYPCQWEEEYKVKRGDNISYGYWNDGSLRTGRLVFVVDLLGTESEKIFKIKIFQNEVFETQPLSYVTSTSVEVGDYIFNFNTTDKTLRSYTKEGVTSVLYPLSIITASDTNVYRDETFDSTWVIKSNGTVFVEVEISGKNDTIGLVRKCNIKMFSCGKVIIENYFITTREINQTLSSAFEVIRMRLGVSASVDSNNSSTILGIAATGDSASVSLISALGQEHREGNDYEMLWSSYANSASMSGDTNVWQLTAGPYKTDTPPPPVIKKGEAFGQMFKIDLNSPYSNVGDVVLSDFNFSVGHIGGRKFYQKTASLLSRTLPFVQGRVKENNGITGHTYLNVCLGKLLLYKLGLTSSGFSELYDDFKSGVESVHGSFSNIGSRYLNSLLVLQFASREVTTQLFHFYREADRLGETTIKNEIASGVESFANAIVTTWDNLGYIPLQYNSLGTNNSNSNASGFQILAAAIATIGDNEDGDYSRVLTEIEDYLSPLYKRGLAFTDKETNNLVLSHYLHYAMYAFHGYAWGCYVLNKENLYDHTNYILSATTGYGELREQLFCVSNSRRGSKETLCYALFALLLVDNSISSSSACEAIMGRLEAGWRNEAGEMNYGNWINTISGVDYLFDISYLSDLYLLYNLKP